MKPVSAQVNAWFYAHLIWRATSMTASFLRIQSRSVVWPAHQSKKLEHDRARKSMWVMQEIFSVNQDGLYWNLG